MYPSHAHIHMNKPFDVRSCIALQYKTAIPGATLKTPGQEQIQPSSLLGLLSHRILKPTEVFLLYICVLKTLSNYAEGLGLRDSGSAGEGEGVVGSRVGEMSSV